MATFEDQAAAPSENQLIVRTGRPYTLEDKGIKDRVEGCKWMVVRVMEKQGKENKYRIWEIKVRALTYNEAELIRRFRSSAGLFKEIV